MTLESAISDVLSNILASDNEEARAAYFTALCIVFHGEDRYRLPILPWLIIEAAVVMARASARRVSRRQAGAKTHKRSNGSARPPAAMRKPSKRGSGCGGCFSARKRRRTRRRQNRT